VRTVRFSAALAAFIAVSSLSGSLWASEADWWALARKASCQELIDAYRTTIAAERKVVAAIKDSRDGTVATNVLGFATLALFGVGFFTWDDNSSAEENLADLRNDLMIIKTVAAEKKCELPAIP
jgi:hypothetical protein